MKTDLTALDRIIARLQNLPPFNVYQVKPDGTVSPWYEVTGAIVLDLAIREEILHQQVSAIGAQIGHWGRLAAVAKRVWEVEERGYRQWRDRVILEVITPPAGDEKWKKPTEAVIEATYRSRPDYAVWQEKIERAEESYNAAAAILDGFKAQREMLKLSVIRTFDGNKAQLAI